MPLFRLLRLIFGPEPAMAPPPVLLENAPSFAEPEMVHREALVPRVTVITVALNALPDLEKTIASVSTQTYPNIEYVVIDGGSCDGTVELLHKSEVTMWVSEQDEGVSDAFNKGIRASSGQWINFLNAGDVFAAPDSISRMMAKAQSEDILTGYVTYGRNMIPNRALSNDDPLHRRAWISHQASFVRRRVFNEVGLFRPEFRVRMDYDFWLRALRSRKFAFIDEVVGHYSAGLSERSIDRFYEEEVVANRVNLGKDWWRDLLVAYSYLGRMYREARTQVRMRLR